MKRNILLPYPSITESLIESSKIGIHSGYSFLNGDGVEIELIPSGLDVGASPISLQPACGMWDASKNDICFKKDLFVGNPGALFGGTGIVCLNAVLGFAIRWYSLSSGQRGAKKIGSISNSKQPYHVKQNLTFAPGQLRGSVTIETVVYIDCPGNPMTTEKHLANVGGLVLGTLETVTVQLDGNGSIFPVYIGDLKSTKTLWDVSCEWVDPTTDSLSDCVALYLNSGHSMYKYIDVKQGFYNSQLLAEIMASAVMVIIEKAQSEKGYWDQIRNGQELSEGSVGQFVYYLMDKLQWDFSNVERLSMSAREFFEEKSR